MGAILGFVLPTIAISTLSPLLIRDTFGNRSSFWDRAAMKATTTFGFYIMLQNSIAFLYTQVDSILIGHFWDAADVGIYAIAVLFAETLTLIPSAVQRVTVPMIASMYGKMDVIGVSNLFFSTLKKSFIVTIISALIIVFLAPTLIVLLFDETYLSCYPSLLILLIGYTVSSALIAVGATLSSIGKVRIPFRISAVSAALNVALNMVLTPHYGIEGAALATTIAMLFYSFITISVVNSYLKREAVLSDT
jgi:O-antigen/teichoic acid export membrane protein